MDTEAEEAKPLTSAQSCLEALVWSLSQALQIKPKQAAGLLLQDNLYLKKIAKKGVKGDFSGLREWYQDVYSNSEHIVALLAEETDAEAVPRVLETLATGLSSPDLDVSLWTCKLLSKLSFEFHDKALSPKLWDWFSSEASHAILPLIALVEDASLTEAAVDVFLHISSGLLPQLFTTILKSTFATTAEYVRFIAKIAEVIFSSAETTSELLETSLITYWSDLALNICGSIHSEARLSAFSLLTQVWVKCYAAQEETHPFVHSVLSALKRGASDPKTLIRASCISCLLLALEQLADERSVQAPAVYKALTLLLLEEQSGSETEYLLLSALSRVLDRYSDISLSPLLTALCRKSQTSPNWSVPTLTLFVQLAKHSQLTLQLAIQLIDVCGRIFLSDCVYARAATIGLASLVTRFLDSEAMQEYLCRLVRVMLVSVANTALEGNTNLSLFEAHSRASQSRMSFSLLAWLLQLSHDSLTPRLIETLSAVHSDYKTASGTDFSEMQRILCEYGYFPSTQEEAEESLELIQPLSENTPALETRRETTQSSSFPYNRVKSDISRIRRLRLEREAQEKLHQEQLKREDEARTRTVRQQLEIRKIEQSLVRGVSESDLAIFPFQSTGKTTAPVEEFLAWHAEEEEDQKTVEIVHQRYKKALKILFRKFAGTGFVVKKEISSNFQSLAERRAKMTEAELVKLLIICKVVPSLVSKESVRSVFKGYCARVAKQHDLTSIDFRGFCAVLPQISYCIYDALSWPAALKYKKLMVHMQLNLNENIDDVEQGDKDVLRRMNEMLRNDPDAPLPTGYFLSHKEDITCVFSVPPILRLRESLVICMEVVDFVLDQVLGVHFIEPVMQILPVPCAKLFRLGGQSPRPPDVKIERPTDVYPTHALSPTLKFELARLPGALRPFGAECAQTLESLLVSLDLGVKKLTVRSQAVKLVAKAEVDRLRNSESWAKHVKAAQSRMLLSKEAREERAKKQKEDEFRRRLAEEEVARRLSERLNKEKEARSRALREWMEQRDAERAQKAAELAEMQRQSEANRKKEQETSYKHFQNRLDAVIKAKQEQWRAARENTEMAPVKLRESREFHQNLASKLLEQDRERAVAKQAMVEKLREFVESEEVRQVLERTARQREVLYKFFCQRADMKIEMEGERELTLAEYAKMAVDIELVPGLISPEVNAYVFKSLTKRKLPEKGRPVTLSCGEFTQALLQIADLAREQLNDLRGQPGDSLEVGTLEALMRVIRVDQPESELKAHLRVMQDSAGRRRLKGKRTPSSVLPVPPLALNTSHESDSTERRSGRDVTPLRHVLTSRRAHPALTKSFELAKSKREREAG